MTAASGDGAGGRRGCLPLLVVGGLLAIVVALLAGNDPGTRGGPPFDPDSVSPYGTRALVELLRAQGARVDVPDTFPPDDADTAVIFSVPYTALDDDGEPVSSVEPRLRRWVREGHTLVVADPSSDLVPRARASGVGFGVAEPLTRGTCSLAALAALDSVQPDRPFLYDVPDGSASCVGSARAAFVVSTAEGRGRIVAVGDPGVFTNGLLGERDNAVLAVDLLAPAAGTRVAVLRPSIFGAGTDAGDLSVGSNLGDLVGPGVRFFVLQLAVGVAVYGWARGRRLGRPVLEPQPVQIAGSELVEARGRLLERTGRPADAARRLRNGLRRDLAPRLGLPADASADLLAQTIADRTGLDPAHTAAALGDVPVLDDEQLLSLARQIESIREEVLHGHAP